MKTSLIVSLVLLAASAGVSAEDEVRSFDDGVFVSEADPAMRVRIDPVFKYLGSDQFILKEVASVDRHHWVKATNGEVQALIVFQFEGYLDGIDGRYRFSLPDAENIGTNGLICSPALCMPFIFDGKSFKPHVDAAFERGITPKIVPGTAFS